MIYSNTFMTPYSYGNALYSGHSPTSAIDPTLMLIMLLRLRSCVDKIKSIIWFIFRVN
jgi:hypothetical protein